MTVAMASTTSEHRDVLGEILRTNTVQSREGKPIALHSHVPEDVGRFLQDMIRRINAEISLEVGMAYGISGLFICDALRQTDRTRHIAIDPFQNEADQWRGIGLKNLHDAGYGRFLDFREQFAHHALPEIEREGVRVDFAFIDAWHTFDHALVDFFLVDKVLRVGGIVVFDDTEWNSVRKACRYVATNRAYRVIGSCGDVRTPSHPLARKLLHKASKTSRRIQRILEPELVQRDLDLGFTPGCRCIAFEKLAEDDGRECFGHHPF